MLGRTYDGQDCSAARTLELVGERWSLLILRDAMFRCYTQFTQFERSLRVAPNILAKRLDGFLAAEIMEVRDGEGSRAGYHLTGRGLDLKPVVIALTEWGDRWLGPGPVDFEHADCGRIDQRLRCRSCGRDVAVADVVAVARSR